MNTEESRPMRFKTTTKVTRMVIKGQAVIILNPTLCLAGKAYRLERDIPSGTGWIREEEGSA